jgi:iron-sulfur cluster repair protein YtfE (RIC family)
MINVSWCAPAGRLDAETARQRIHGQHDQIRGLLDRARAVAELALDGRPPAPDAVASAIGDIRATMTVHLTFEENVLLPILDDDVPLGPERGRRMVDEHKRQRAMLEACTERPLPVPNCPHWPSSWHP